MSSDEEERQAWIADVKRRLGIRCMGDEPAAAETAHWPDYADGSAYRIVSDRAMASWDGFHWYEKPDGMTMAEFLDALP